MYGATIGRLGILGVAATVNQACCVFSEPRGIEPGYWFYWLQMARPYLISLGYGGGQPNLSQDLLRSLRVPVPDLDEQCAIIRFLDRETARIDALVAKKERLIELLHERLSASITRAVRTDLDASGSVREPGSQRHDAIPANWTICSMGRQIVLQRGVDITKDQQKLGTVPVVSSGGVSSYHDHALAKGPGVVVGRKGSAGTIYYVASDYWPHDTTLWVKDFHGNLPRFVFYKLSTLDLKSFDTGTANPTLNRNLIHPIRVSWPPIDDQEAIVSMLDAEATRTDALVAAIHNAIAHIKELRSALISAAVTGKIDVREAMS
jgi:type I restriction enzyme S subunit